MKRVVVLLVLSLAISTAAFFINSDVIEYTLTEKLVQIAVLAIPIFIIVSLLYFINKAVVKKAKSIKTKKPSV